MIHPNFKSIPKMKAFDYIAFLICVTVGGAFAFTLFCLLVGVANWVMG